MAGLLNASALDPIYQKYLGRAPDQAGADWWEKSGTSADKVESLIAGSPEAKSFASKNAAAGLLNAPAPTQAYAHTSAPALDKPVATYNPLKATSGTASTTLASAVKATGTGYDATKVNMTPEMSSAYQLDKITRADSPLNTSARTFADQQSNRRGLLNSSIAVGASQDAVLRNAMPLAQQDANTWTQKGLADASSTNRASEFTAGARNTADLTNAQLGTDVSKYNAGSENDTSKFNVQQDAQTSQFNATAGNSALSQQVSATNQVSLQRMQEQLQRDLAAIQANTQMSVADKQVASQKAIAAANIASQEAISSANNATQAGISAAKNANDLLLANKDNETKKLLAAMDVEARTNLANINNAHDTLIKNNASASSLMQQAMAGLASISSSTMDQTAKDTATQNMLTTLANSLDAVANYDSLRLSEYFPNVAVTPPPATYDPNNLKDIGTINVGI